MSRRAYHWLFLGSTGSGKTHTARDVLRAYVRKPDYVVIVNSSGQLSEFARVRVVVDIQALEREWTPEGLAALIRRAGAVHFEVSPGGEPKRIQAFMDALGAACMALGVLDTDRCHVLLVMDECQNYISQKVFSRGMRRVYSEGRKYGVDTMAITQQLAGQGGEIIDMTAKRMVSVVVVCPMDEHNERARVLASFPELPDPAGLAMPDPARGRAGDYLIRDRLTRRAALVTLDRLGRRIARPIARPTPGGPHMTGQP